MPALKIRADTIAAIGATVVGVAALFVAWDQARIMRRAEHASLLPIVSVDHQHGYQGERVTYRLLIENKGVGPALVRDGEFDDDGSLSDYAERIISLIDAPYSYSTNSLDGVTLAVGETRTLVSIDWFGREIGQEEFNQVVATASETEYKVCFCSVFDRCWAASADAPPAPTRACSAASLAPPL